MRGLRGLLAIFVLVGLTWGCSGPAASPATASMHVDILGTRPHDVTAFTQGFEVAGRSLLEGTGQVGQSRVTSTDLLTGAELRRVELPGLFGEGITSTGAALWQLTWRDGVAIERDPVTLAERRRVPYQGEGWGLCMQRTGADRLLVMSDGTSRLALRDPNTFDVVRTVEVAGMAGAPINELECAEDGSVYANVWQTDTILRIDPATGTPLAVIDASTLRSALPSTAGIDVLNGIAQLPGTDRFLVTGKLWPTTFEVRFVA